MLFETTADPALRRVYAAIAYAYYNALIEIAALTLGAYSDLWGRSACEKPAFLTTWERQTRAFPVLQGFPRHHTPYHFTDRGQAYRYKVVALPLDGVFVALRCESGNVDGNATVLAYFDQLASAFNFVERHPGPDVAMDAINGALSHV